MKGSEFRFGVQSSELSSNFLFSIFHLSFVISLLTACSIATNQNGQ